MTEGLFTVVNVVELSADEYRVELDNGDSLTGDEFYDVGDTVLVEELDDGTTLYQHKPN